MFNETPPPSPTLATHKQNGRQENTILQKTQLKFDCANCNVAN